MKNVALIRLPVLPCAQQGAGGHGELCRAQPWGWGGGSQLCWSPWDTLSLCTTAGTSTKPPLANKSPSSEAPW